jgi:hypothetical protein
MAGKTSGSSKGGGSGKSGKGKSGKTTTLKPTAKGEKPISFKPGGLHQSLGVPAGQPIPPAKMAAAQAGKFGPKAQQQANFAVNVLGKGQRTAAANRSTTTRTRGATRGTKSR